MKLIFGLGNPGREYELTRHNIGFRVLMALNTTYQSKFNSYYFEKIINNEKVIFIMPQTFMNLSGQCVNEWKKFYKVDNQDILIIFDDKDLKFNTIKFTNKGSSGGHNGVKSIITYIGSDFPRLKIGINNEQNFNTTKFVLQKFNQEEEIVIPDIINESIKVINNFVEGNLKNFKKQINEDK